MEKRAIRQPVICLCARCHFIFDIIITSCFAHRKFSAICPDLDRLTRFTALRGKVA